MSIEEAIKLFERLYQNGEEGLTIDANIAREIKEMIEHLKSELPAGKYTTKSRCEKLCWFDVSKKIDKKEYIPKLITCPKQGEINKLEAENKGLKEAMTMQSNSINKMAHDYIVQLQEELKAKDERIAELKEELKKYKPKNQWESKP